MQTLFCMTLLPLVCEGSKVKDIPEIWGKRPSCFGYCETPFSNAVISCSPVSSRTTKESTIGNILKRSCGEEERGKEGGRERERKKEREREREREERGGEGEREREWSIH